MQTFIAKFSVLDLYTGEKQMILENIVKIC